MDELMMRKLAAELPADLVVSLRRDGLSKVASALTGVPVYDEYSVYQKIGAELFRRRLEHLAVVRGLASFDGVGDP